jgi:hypothetical protein
MKIVYEHKPTFKFSEVSIGEVFFAEDMEEYGESPYMRISDVKDIDNDYYNVVDLQDGKLVYFNDDELIILCNATLKIY